MSGLKSEVSHKGWNNLWSFELVYRQRCSGIFVKPPCGAVLSRYRCWTVRVKDWRSGKSLD